MKVSVKKPGTPAEVLEHHGVKGMKWGVRNTARSVGSSRAGKAVGRGARKVGRGAENVRFALVANSHETQHKIVLDASSKMTKSLPSIKARHGEYGKLSNRAKKPFSKEARAYRADVKKTYLKHLETSANAVTNKQGTLQYTLKESGKPNTKQYLWTVQLQKVQHADSGATDINVQPIFDEEGWIVDLKVLDNNMEQAMNRGADFLIHAGIEV